jgi:hypothetical protein
MAKAHRALAVRSRLEQRDSAPMRHEGDRGVTPLGGVLAPEAEDVPVPALGDLLIADGKRDVIQALEAKPMSQPYAAVPMRYSKRSARRSKLRPAINRARLRRTSTIVWRAVSREGSLRRSASATSESGSST